MYRKSAATAQTDGRIAADGLLYIGYNNKQIFHAFLFNIRNYSPEVNNIQWLKVELNIILLKVNNFDIKQKMSWNICFIICHQHQKRFGKLKASKTQHISVKTQVLFRKDWTTTYLTTTPSKSFYIIFVDIFFWNH